MVVPLQSMRFYRTGATADGTTVLDPNLSLGGFRAAQGANLVSTLTAAMTQLGTLIDSTQVDDTPAGPVDPRSPLVNSGNYTQAANLLHWYRFGYDPVDLSTDYGVGTKIPLSVIRGSLGAGDIETQQPGQFDQQRRSVHFNSGGVGDNQALVTASIGQTWGFANAWSIGGWFRPTTVAAGTSVLWVVASATPDTVSSIRVQREGADLRVVVTDQTTLTTQKEQVYTGFFTANTWHHVIVTWDGSAARTYRGGSLIAVSTQVQDDAVTMADPGNRRLIIGGRRPGFADPTEEWLGQIHSVGLWSTTLPAAAITQLAGFGDGVGPDPLNHAGDWLIFVTGANAFEARRIAFHNNATGEMRMEQPFPNLAASGDFYRIGRALDLWNDGPTPVECAEGLIDYRLVGFRNESGEQLLNLRFWLKPLDPRSIRYEIVASEDTPAAGFPSIANDEILPDLNTLTSAGFSNHQQAFRAPRDFATATETPVGSAGADVNLANNATAGIWIRRIVDPLTRRGRSAWLLVAEAASGSVSGAGPWRSAMVLLSEPVGYTPNLELQFDRTPRTFGGSRLIARLTDLETGTPVEGVPVFIDLVSGPGTISSPSVQPIETDENGEVQVQYHASDNEGDVGATVVAEARFFDEVAL